MNTEKNAKFAEKNSFFDKKEDAAEARKEAEKYLYKDFLKWYAETFPDRWKKLNSIKK